MKKQHYFVTGLILVILSFSFYWYELRPGKIVKQCSIEAEKSTTQYATVVAITESEFQANYNFQLKKCLEKKGIVK